MKKLMCLLTVVILVAVSVPGGRVAAQEPCPFPEGYQDDVFDSLQDIGSRIAAVDTTDAAALSLFYVEVYQLRHRYENMTMDIPLCALRAHAIFTNMLGNWEDILGLAMATLANPDAAQDYINEIAVINQRIEFFSPKLMTELFPPVPPTAIPPTPTEAPVLQVFYVATLGLNVRNGPGAEHDAIGVLTGGTPIQVLSLDTLDNGDVWYMIRFPESPDGVGWVFGPLITAEPPADFPEPLPTDRLPTVTPQP